MSIEELKKSGRYTDEEVAELAEFFNKEREKRSIKDKKIKKLEDAYKKLVELYPDEHFYVEITIGYESIEVDVLDLLDCYFNNKALNIK